MEIWTGSFRPDLRTLVWCSTAWRGMAWDGMGWDVPCQRARDSICSVHPREVYGMEKHKFIRLWEFIPLGRLRHCWQWRAFPVEPEWTLHSPSIAVWWKRVRLIFRGLNITHPKSSPRVAPKGNWCSFTTAQASSEAVKGHSMQKVTDYLIYAVCNQIRFIW